MPDPVQWTVLDDLEERLARLTDKIHTVDGAGGAGDPAEQLAWQQKTMAV